MKTNKILILLFISMSVACYAQKKISGSQSGILGPGKYIVAGNIKIEAGKSLTIAPGTTFIHESGNYIWEISGSFKAIGTLNDSIYFLSKDGIEQNKRWSGLRFLEGSPAAILDYCVVDNAFIKVDFDLYSYSFECFAAVNVWKGAGISIKHCRISNNYSTNNGGGVYVKEGFVFIDSCRITHNYQQNLAKGIGVFFEESDSSQISNSVIAYNTGNFNVSGTAGGGGGIHCLNSNTIISGCLIYKNSIPVSGGGIMASEDCMVTLKNNTIAYNVISDGVTVPDGATGLSNAGPSLNLTHSGGGIATIWKATFSGENNIIYANISPENLQIRTERGGVTNLTYTCTSQKISGKGNIFTDPLFVNPKKDDFRLRKDSPCIKAGKKQDGTSTNMGAL